jgi:hypothetical protein
MTVYEFVVRHGADFAQGAVILGVLIAVCVGWRILSNAIDWAHGDAIRASDESWLAMNTANRCLREVDALKTRVKSLEDAAGRAKKRDADKAQVRVAKVA